MSGFDFGGALDVFTGGVSKVIDVAGKVAEAKFSWQARNLDMQLKNSQLQQAKQSVQLNDFIAKSNAQIAMTQAQSQVDLQKVQAEYQLKRAQEAANNGYFDLLQANMSTGIGNLQSTLNGQNSGSGIMLWLTVAGVAIAAFQLVKGR